MINKGILHRFYKGIATVSEETEVKKWIEETEENKKFFFQERKLYDSILFNKKTLQTKHKIAKQKKLFTWSSFINVAAVLLFIITVGLLTSKYFENRTRSDDLHTIIVPAGQRINLILADNSSIWLNANTIFKYPTEFSKKHREVYLDGEGYFDVSANKKKPFIVTTPQGGIQVTGTKFNVSAYSEYEKFETSLFSGNISVYLKNNAAEIINIRPTQKAILQNGKLKIEGIKDYDEFLWIKGLIAFNNEQIEEILAVLGQFFDTKIQIDTSSLPNNTYTGKFRQSDGIDYALRVLQKSIYFTYERDNEEQVIYIKTAKS